MEKEQIITNLLAITKEELEKYGVIDLCLNLAIEAIKRLTMVTSDDFWIENQEVLENPWDWQELEDPYDLKEYIFTKDCKSYFLINILGIFMMRVLNIKNIN